MKIVLQIFSILDKIILFFELVICEKLLSIIWKRSIDCEWFIYKDKGIGDRFILIIIE